MINRRYINTRSGIRTRYHGPTNCSGSRISASFGTRRIYIPYSYDLNESENHALAAQSILDKYNDLEYDDGVLRIDPLSGLCFDGDYYWSWNIVQVDQEGAA